MRLCNGGGAVIFPYLLSAAGTSRTGTAVKPLKGGGFFISQFIFARLQKDDLSRQTPPNSWFPFDQPRHSGQAVGGKAPVTEVNGITPLYGGPWDDAFAPAQVARAAHFAVRRRGGPLASLLWRGGVAAERRGRSRGECDAIGGTAFWHCRISRAQEDTVEEGRAANDA